MFELIDVREAFLFEQGYLLRGYQKIFPGSAWKNSGKSFIRASKATAKQNKTQHCSVEKDKDSINGKAV